MIRPKEGDLFKTVSLEGRTFVIRYGFYADFERENPENDPIPIYPDFRTHPVYTADGYPFVTQMQDLCPHGESLQKEAYCVDCPHFRPGEELIGVCRHEANRRI